MQHNRVKPPDAYAFLCAAGEIDFHGERKFSQVRRCGEELVRLSHMNGSYERLPPDFCENMRAIFDLQCDKQTAARLGELGQKLLDIENLTDRDRVAVRALCSQLARYWPMEPRVLLVQQKAKVPD